MAIESYFFNAVKTGDSYDRIYNAQDMTNYLNLLVGNGVFPTPSTQLQVRASTGMNVIIGAGSGWINGHKMVNTVDMSLTIPDSDVLLNRIDAVIFYVDWNSRTMGIEVKEGTPASSPVAPTLTRTDDRYEMCLAQISVTKQITAITTAMITDTRGNSNLCGYVAGLIQQIDTSTLFEQFDAGFNDWFDQVKDTLATATLLQKLEQVFTTTSTTLTSFDVTNYIPSYKYVIDILEVYIDGLRLDKNEYTMNQSTVTLLTPITHAGTEVSLVVYKSIDGSDAETVVEQVQEMKPTVDAIETGMYVATGEDDNVKLSQVVKTFLNGGNDYRQLEIDVYGELACTQPASEITESNIAYWFDFNVQNSTRRVKLNFAHSNRIIIDAEDSGSATDVFMYANNTEIANLQAVMNNIAAGQMIVGDSICTDCAFWMNGLSGQTGSIIGAEQGTFIRCRMSVTAINGLAYGFSGNGNVLKLNNCEVIAYNVSSASNESVAVHVKGNETSNILLMTNCTCPVTTRSGYKQDNVVKVNSGYYSLVANVLGKNPALYSTGTGKTELGSIYTSGGGKTVGTVDGEMLVLG